MRLADWLNHKRVGYVSQTKEDKYYQQPGQDYRLISRLGLAPGHAFYLKGINLTKQKGFGGFNLGGYWSKKGLKMEAQKAGIY